MQRPPEWTNQVHFLLKQQLVCRHARCRVARQTERMQCTEWSREPIRSLADASGCNGWGRGVLGHDSTELDAQMA